MPTAPPPNPAKESNRPAVMDNWMNSMTEAMASNVEPPAPLPPVEPAPKPAAIAPKPEPEPPAPKPTPVPAPEPAPVAKVDEEKVPRTSREWNTFKETRDKKYQEFEATIANLSKEKDELSKKSTAMPPDYEAIKKERDDLSNIIQQVSVENHPRFKAYYDKAMQSQIGIAKGIVGQEKGGELEKLLMLPDSDYKTTQIESLISELPMLQQTRIGAVLNQIETVRQERDGQVANSKENYKLLQEKENGKRMEMQKKMESTFEQALTHLKGKEGSPLFQTKEGDADWNKSIEERAGVAKNYLFGNVPPEQLIQAAFQAASFPAILQQTKGLMAEVTQLKKQIADMSAAAPKIATERSHETNGNGAAPRVAQPKNGSRPMDVMRDSWMKNLPQFGEQS